MTRINLGGEYETTDKDGNEVTRYREWIDVSNALMNQVSGEAIQNNVDPSVALAERVLPEGFEVVESED